MSETPKRVRHCYVNLCNATDNCIVCGAMRTGRRPNWELEGERVPFCPGLSYVSFTTDSGIRHLCSAGGYESLCGTQRLARGVGRLTWNEATWIMADGCKRCRQVLAKAVPGE